MLIGHQFHSISPWMCFCLCSSAGTNACKKLLSHCLLRCILNPLQPQDSKEAIIIDPTSELRVQGLKLLKDHNLQLKYVAWQRFTDATVVLIPVQPMRNDHLPCPMRNDKGTFRIEFVLGIFMNLACCLKFVVHVNLLGK